VPPEKKKTCFVIAPIGAEDSATRKRSDQLYKYVIEHVLKPYGYKIERADKVGEPGIITNQIVKRIVDCDILIADLSEHNPNVFYELAIRHGLKKPFVHIIDAGQAIPFDNAQVRTIQVNLTDLDSVESARRQLDEQVKAIEGGSSVVESPISVAFDLESLKSSGKPDDAVMAAVLEEITSLRREIRAIRNAPIRRFASDTFTPQPGMPRTFEDLVLLFVANNESDLAFSMKNDLTLHKFDPPDLIFTGGLHLPANTDQRIGELLRKWTGKHWRVEILPF
jgi:hypothetical protein